MKLFFYPTFYRKTYTNLLIFVLFVCSFFLLFNLSSFIRFSMINQVLSLIREWLAQVDSNHRPRAYQARALTTWAMRHYGYLLRFPHVPLVEMMGIEPMTPCLQGRCSPSWATPPSGLGIIIFFFSKSVTENWTTSKSLFPQYSTFTLVVFPLLLVCFLPICKYEISVSDISHSP